MAHGYHTLQHWNHWLKQHFLGANLLKMEEQTLARILANHFGKHVLLIGVPEQASLLNASQIPCQTLLSPFGHHLTNIMCIESDLYELPLFSGSVDLVLLPHTMEFLDNPRQLLAEACRIVKPEGLIAITGFNPMSAWGAKKLLTKVKKIPWTANFISKMDIIRWLKLADFAMEQQKSILYRPPVKRLELFEQLNFLEKVGATCFPALGGIYIVLARAKVIPLTPIKMKWKQQLSSIRMSPTLPRHVRLLF